MPDETYIEAAQSTGVPATPSPAKKPRRPRGPSKMIVGVEMTLSDLIAEYGGQVNPNAKFNDTTVIWVRGRTNTVKNGDVMAAKLALTGTVVIATERAKYTAGVRQQWFKGVGA